MAGLFEDIGRTNALGSASQTFLENAMRLRQQGNAEREAAATAFRQGEMLRIQQAQESRQAAEFVQKEKEAKIKFDEDHRERDATSSAYYLAMPEDMRKPWLDAQIKSGTVVVGADGIPRTSKYKLQSWLNTDVEATKMAANVADRRAQDAKSAVAEAYAGLERAKQDGASPDEIEKKTKLYQSRLNYSYLLSDNAEKAKIAAMRMAGEATPVGVVPAPGLPMPMEQKTGGAGQGTKKPTHMMPDGTLLYPSGSGLAQKITDAEGNVTLSPVSAEEEKLARMLPPSMPGDKASFETLVGEEHPDWPYSKVREEAAKRSMAQTVSSTATPNIAYDESGKAIGNIVTKRDRSGNIMSTVVLFPSTVPAPKAEGGGKKPVEAGGAIKETDNAQEQRLSFHSDAAVVRKALDKTLGPAFTGPVEGRLMRVEQALGIQNDKDRAKALAALKLNISTMTKAVSGLAASDQERQFILEQNPNPKDGIEELIGKYELLKERMDEYYKNDRASWRDTPTARKRLEEIWKPFSSAPASPPVATFKTEAEAREAFKAGKVKKGDRVVINGKSGTL